MALIKSFLHARPERVRVHEPVSCTFHWFIDSGEEFLQLDTYGSDDRVMPGKVSQSIQLDRAGAQELLAILRQAFPALSEES
jgi:hypothetical protein